MTLIVTPGDASADAYITTENLDTAMAGRSISEWAELKPSAKEAANRAVTIFVDTFFSSEFSGTKTNGRAQSREWPRTNATDVNDESLGTDEIPVELTRAIIEALILNVQDGVVFDTSQFTEQVTTREKIGPLDFEYGDDDGEPVEVDLRKALRPYLRNILSSTYTLSGYGITGLVV